MQLFLKGGSSNSCSNQGSAAAEDLLRPRNRYIGSIMQPLARSRRRFHQSKVMRHSSRQFVCYAGGVPVLLWKEPPSAHQQELLHRLQNVASLAKGRLSADFPRNGSRSALAMFDRRLVLKGLGPLPGSYTRRSLMRGVRQLASLLGSEEQSAVLQYNGVPHMIILMGLNQPLAQTNEPAR